MPDQTRPKANNRCALITLVVGVVIGCIAGILIGRYGVCPDEEKKEVPKQGLYLSGVPESLMRDEDKSIIDDLINSIKSENIRRNLQYV